MGEFAPFPAAGPGGGAAALGRGGGAAALAGGASAALGGGGGTAAFGRGGAGSERPVPLRVPPFLGALGSDFFLAMLPFPFWTGV